MRHLVQDVLLQKVQPLFLPSAQTLKGLPILAKR